MKVVIDTNIFISFLLGKLLSNLITHISKNQVKIITSKEQLAEILNVVNKPKPKKYILKSDLIHLYNSDLIHLYNYITNYSEFVELENNIKVCRDPKDDYLLEIAVNGKAEFLITGDNDLIDLEKFHETEIITYSEFEKILENSF